MIAHSLMQNFVLTAYCTLAIPLKMSYEQSLNSLGLISVSICYRLWSFQLMSLENPLFAISNLYFTTQKYQARQSFSFWIDLNPFQYQSEFRSCSFNSTHYLMNQFSKVLSISFTSKNSSKPSVDLDLSCPMFLSNLASVIFDWDHSSLNLILLQEIL